MRENKEDVKEGKYIYCIIGSNEPRKYGPTGIGGRKDMVYTSCHNGLAAVISDTPVKKYPVNRPNTICHQRVMEDVMKYHTVLPVRFCTVAEDREPQDGVPAVSALERIRQRVLEERQKEFSDLLADMETKVELGVKAIWLDMKETFKDILEENPQIKKLKEKIEGINAVNPRRGTHRERVKLGEMVKDTLKAKKEKLKNVIMGVLKRSSKDARINKEFGDNMIVNGAFLVEKEKVGGFEEGLEKLSKTYGDKIKFKYVGPVPPCNFVEVVISWE